MTHTSPEEHIYLAECLQITLNPFQTFWANIQHPNKLYLHQRFPTTQLPVLNQDKQWKSILLCHEEKRLQFLYLF